MLFVPFADKLFDRLKPTIYDDMVDRVNYYITSLLLLFFAIMVAGKQFVGSPIQCWVPAQFKGGWEQYTEDYCFIENTYHVKFDEPIPRHLLEREDKEIGYYQWVPIVLALQALLFYLPNFLWKLLCAQSGVSMKTVMSNAISAKSKNVEDKKKQVNEIAIYLRESLNCENGAPQKSCLCIRTGRNLGSYISCLYLLVKIIYLINIGVQFKIMNAIGSTYRFWGIQILIDILHGRQWGETGHFPRVTLCDFDVRVLGNIQHHTIQCVLMINMFNEKIYLVLWFWVLMVGVLTLINVFYWLVQMIVPGSRVSAVRKFLKIAPGPPLPRTTVSKFVDRWLKPDGVLILRFVGARAGEMIAAKLTRAMFDDYERQLAAVEAEKNRSAGYDSGKGSSPTGGDEGFVENSYEDGPAGKQPLLEPNAPEDEGRGTMRGYPGPPAVAPKPKLMEP